MWYVYFDGWSRGNPGPSGIRYVITKDGKVVAKGKEEIGIRTNNEAEWTALIRALEKARELGAKDPIIRGDSQLVIRQINGHYKTSPKFQTYKELAKEMMQTLGHCRVEWVPREQNLAG